MTARRRPRSARTSRSSSARCTAAASSTSTRPTPRRSRRRCSTPWSATTSSRTPTCTAAPTSSPRRPPPPSRAPAPRSPGSSARRTPARSCSPRTPPRPSTSSPRRGAAPTSTAGDAVVLTELEHHANIVPWHQLHDELGVELRWIPIRPDGHLDLTDLDRLVDGAKVVTFAAMSNVLGTLLPVERLVERRPRRRRHRGGRRVAVRPPPRHRRAGLGRRLRRLHRPQDVRPHRHRRALGHQPRSSRPRRRSSPAAR